MRKFTAEERRARLAIRHHLAPRSRVKTAMEVARDLVGLHGTDPATVFVSAWARMKNADVEGIESELYDDRSLVRVLVMRRTAFVLPLLAVDGRLVRGRPRGGWLSTQWSWATMESWLGKALRAWTIDEAQAELVRLWLKAFGPATVEDVRWWTGWTLAEVRRALT